MTAPTKLLTSQLKPSKDNPRRNLGDLTELVASIKSLGILEPIVVTKNGAGYDVVVGHRRLAAAKRARLKEVPVVIRTFTDAERTEAMLIENLQRTDLAPLEEASAFHALVETHGYSQRTIAERIGRNQSHVSKRLALLKLPAAATKALDAGSITIEQAVDLTKLVDKPKVIERLVAGQRRIDDWAIKDAVRKAADDEKRDARIEALTKKGVVARAGLPNGAEYIQSWGRTQHIDPKKHAKEECHLVIVRASYGNVHEDAACSDLARHPAPEGGSTGPAARKETAAERRRRLHHEELAKAAEIRQAFLKTLAEKSVPKDADDVIAWSAIAADLEIPELTFTLLGFNDEEAEPSFDGAGLEGFVAADPGERLRWTAFCVALATGEESLSAYWRGAGWSSARGKAYIAFLRRHGYVLSDVETAELEGTAPK